MKSVLTTTIAVLIVAFSFGQCDMNGALSVFGLSGDQTGHTVVESSDGGYFFLGVSVNGGTKIMVVKTDEYLVKLWAKTYGTGNAVEGQAVVATSDGMGGCVFSGYEMTNYRNAICTRIDADGNILWSKKLPASNNDTPRDIFKTDNGLFVLCGTTNSYGSGSSDAFVQVFDIDGSSLWSRTVGNAGNEHFYSGFQNLAGNYVFGGHSDYNLNGRQSWVVEMTPNGDVIKDVIYADGFNAYISDMCQDASGFYYLAGCQFNSGTADSWIAKLDANYQIVWSKEISSTGADRGLSVHLNNESEVVTTSVSDGIGSLSSLLITRLDPALGDFMSNTIVDFSINETTHILAKNSFMRSDNRLVLYGASSSFSNGLENMICMTDPCLLNDCIAEELIQLNTWNLTSNNAAHSLVSLNDFFDYSLSVQDLNLPDLADNELCIYKGVNEIQNMNHISLFPNPTSASLTLNVSQAGLKNFLIYGMDGKLIKSGNFQSLNTEIDVEELSAGIYVLVVMGSSGSEHIRFEKK
jgi:hypothetical protein